MGTTDFLNKGVLHRFKHHYSNAGVWITLCHPCVQTVHSSLMEKISCVSVCACVRGGIFPHFLQKRTNFPRLEEGWLWHSFSSLCFIGHLTNLTSLAHRKRAMRRGDVVAPHAQKLLRTRAPRRRFGAGRAGRASRAKGGRIKTKWAARLFWLAALLRSSLSELVSENIMQRIRMKSPDTPVVKATG